MISPPPYKVWEEGLGRPLASGCMSTEPGSSLLHDCPSGGGCSKWCTLGGTGVCVVTQRQRKLPFANLASSVVTEEKKAQPLHAACTQSVADRVQSL